MSLKRWLTLCFSLAGVLVSALIWHVRPPVSTAPPPILQERVVIAAPLQLLLTGGDRFLAADIESVRSIVTAADSGEAVESNLSFAIRTRKEVARLNPCHEDNYYLSNALLTWGGAAQEGNEILQRASNCRGWDEFPAFFLGFNLFYFSHDIQGARIWLEKAAERSPDNAASFRKLGIMLAAGEIKDNEAALAFLQNERQKTGDAKLQQMLDRRIGRLQGLMLLRNATHTYEARFHKPLDNPNALIESGLLNAFPSDPMRIGYEFRNGQFYLREIKVAGAERPQ